MLDFTQCSCFQYGGKGRAPEELPRVHTAHARRFLRRSCWVIPTSGEVSHTITLTRPNITHPWLVERDFCDSHGIVITNKSAN